MTYGELDAIPTGWPSAWSWPGCAGYVVGLQLPNIAQFLVAYFGILKAGGVVMPLNVLLKAPEVGYQLQDSGPGSHHLGRDSRRGGQGRRGAGLTPDLYGWSRRCLRRGPFEEPAGGSRERAPAGHAGS